MITATKEPQKEVLTKESNQETKMSSILLKEPPKFNFCRLDDLNSFLVMGIDIKINPKNEVHIIEINGIDSGMDGFGIAKVPYLEENSLLYHNNPCENALSNKISRLGIEILPYIGKELSNLGIYAFRIEETTGVLNDEQMQKVNPLWKARYGKTIMTINSIQNTLDNKIIFDMFCDEIRHIKPTTLNYSKENVEKIIEEYNPKRLVVKPQNEKQGEGVSIFETHTFGINNPKLNTNLVVEPFIESKPILCKQDNQPHDGCMRYIVFVEHEKNENIKIHHIGGYWRLAPLPIFENKLDSYRANLGKKAIAQRATNEELSLVKKTIDGFLPNTYQKISSENKYN